MPPTVLVVEGETAYAKAYAWWLSAEYDVRTAATLGAGPDVLSPAIDVVVLDRRLPEGGGGTIIEAIEDRELACRVAIITSTEPDFDVIDLDIQEYMVRPISKTELLDVVERLIQLATYDEYVQEIYALASKKAALEAAKSSRELEASPAFTTLERRLDAATRHVEDTFDQLASDRSFRDLYEDFHSSRA